jgi:3-oxoacyl-ACP reductase-like protein
VRTHLQFLLEREKALRQRDVEQARQHATATATAAAAAAASAAAAAAAQYKEKHIDCPEHALALLSADSGSHINRIKQESLAYVGVNAALKQVRWHF